MFSATQYLGTDVILPGIEWLQTQRKRICAIVITHGHEDHIGALPFVLNDLGNPPIYATPFTLELIRARLQKHKCSSSSPMQTVQVRQPFRCGPFSIEAFGAAHSIPGGIGLAISTSAGCIIHTGDFKLDPAPPDGITTDLATLGRYADRGVLALLADSTNVEHSGFSASESDLDTTFSAITAQCNGNVFITTFSSNIYRIQTAITVAERAGRKVILLGQGLCENVHIACNLGLLHVKPHSIIRAEQVSEYTPEHKLCIIASGCQGEAGSAMQRLASRSHPGLEITSRDSVIISARTIPGNELQVNAMLNQLYHLGARIFTASDAQVHVSGHACTEELRQLISVVKPQFFIPVHGESRHLVQHAQLAQQCGIEKDNTLVLRDGTGVTLSHNGKKIEPAIPCTSTHIDMHNGTPIEPTELKERKQMGRGGCVHINVDISHAAPGAGTYTPAVTVTFQGINKHDRHTDLEARIISATHALVAQTLPQRTASLHLQPETALPEQVHREISTQSAALCKKILRYRPLVAVAIHHL
jgi:ribonuclease J